MRVYLFLCTTYISNLMSKKKKTVSEYGVRSNVTSMPGCCSVDELHSILDNVEKNFSAGKGICHEEALKRITSW